MDHDQRIKELVRLFLADFFRVFFPHWHGRFDFSSVEWLDKDLFVEFPHSGALEVDLLARVGLTEPEAGWQIDPPSYILLIHFEIESGESVARLPRRMAAYGDFINRRHQLPYLPIGIYLRVGREGIGWEEHVLQVFGETIRSHRYAYVGLPALDAEKYVEIDSLLALALSSLMKIETDKRPEFKARVLQRIYESNENSGRKAAAMECFEAYLDLAPDETRHFERILASEPKYAGVKAMMKTTRELGIEEGLQQGLEKGREEGREEGRREALKAAIAGILRKRFQADPATVLDKLAAYQTADLERIYDEAIDAKDLTELRL